MTHDHLLAPPTLSLDEALFAMEATTDRCLLLDAQGQIERTNLPWQRSNRLADPVALLSAREGDDFVAACGRAALHGNRDAGSLHAQVKAVLAGMVERAQLTFTRAVDSSCTEDCEVVVEHVRAEGGRRALVSFSTTTSGDAAWTNVPEAGFSVPCDAPFTQLAAALESLATHAVILDARGRIAAINAAWRAFSASNGGTPEATGLGVSYISVCRKAASGGDERAASFLDGLLAVLRGEQATHVQKTRIGFGGEAKPFVARATAMSLSEGRFTLITHTQVAAIATAPAPAAVQQAA